MSSFDVESRWPELFDGLTVDQRAAVIDSLGSAWYEGWVPNREDVENVTDHARGALTDEEYLRRADEAAERERGGTRPAVAM